MATATEVKERPIIFTGDSVLGILECHKTQTRRVMPALKHPEWTGYMILANKSYAIECGPDYPDDESDCVKNPYGVTGDRLWVRETWATGKSLDRMNVMQIVKSASEAGFSPGAPIWYRADGAYQAWGDDDERDFDGKGRIRAAMFMPRWASRLTLELTDVRVERVQDIGDDDCKSEGCVQIIPEYPRNQFRDVWDSINAKRGYGWEKNPWVWAITFKKLESNQ